MAREVVSTEVADDSSEYITRKMSIDKNLRRVGWVRGKDWSEEVELQGMPNASGTGYADYVLWGDDGKPLAVVEAKRFSKEPEYGRHQAKLYADLLECRYHRRPIIFLSNGYTNYIWDDLHYPERKVSGIYSKSDLEKLMSLESNRSKILRDCVVDDNITNRYYQKTAIRAVCTSFETGRRRALLVMATGSGKTRTTVSLVQILLSKGWIKNVLFLADRTTLVRQAKKAFVNSLPDLSVTNICESKHDSRARCVLSTYQTMINLIDTEKDEDGRLVFTPGHFDLIITDEAHRSIYNRYGSIFEYFDSLLLGLTATPKDEVDRNTYGLFGLPKGEPTYAYELSQAIKDGYLVDYYSIETKLKFMEEGILYMDLTEEERESYEEHFLDPDGLLPEMKSSSELNEWIFNHDTIVKVLDILMKQGHKIDYGSKIGKTIIFAKNHRHAEKIREVFDQQYPHLLGQCQVIDNKINYADDLIDNHFKIPDRNPMIAVSVDMLDTGIDVPEILNLVFFKKVYSKSKFWQMIGRGTRLCNGLLDGEDKKDFYIFDFCSNFEFFNVNPKGRDGDTGSTIQSRIFMLKVKLIWKLNDIFSISEESEAFRKELVGDTVAKITELNRDSFAVSPHLRCIDLFSKPERFGMLTEDDIHYLEQEVAGLIEPYTDGDVFAVSFDSLMYFIEFAKLTDYPRSWPYKEARKRVSSLTNVNVPDVTSHKETISRFVQDGYLEGCSYLEIDELRKELRDIMHYMPEGKKAIHDTDFRDTILSMEINDSNIQDMGLQNYRDKAELYIRKHKDEDVIKKLHTNEPLTEKDVSRLESILWSELGTEDEYRSVFGNKPLGVLVREIVGLDMSAAKEAFSSFINETSMTNEQYYFINQIVEYVAKNGVIEDMSVLMSSPFTDRGSIVDLFGSDMDSWIRIKGVIDSINRNAEIAVQ